MVKTLTSMCRHSEHDNAASGRSCDAVRPQPLSAAGGSLSIGELARITGGRLRLASLPPLGGLLEPIGRIVTRMSDVAEGDVFWVSTTANGRQEEFIEAAYARGALGVVLAGRRIEPWAGRFVLEVKDSVRALFDVAAASRKQYTGGVVAVIQSDPQPPVAGWLAAVLEAHYPRVCRIKATHGLGDLAAAVCNWPAETDFAVVELNPSLEGEAVQGVRLCCPHAGVIAAFAEDGKERRAKWDCQKESLAAAIAAFLPNGWLIVDGEDLELNRICELRRCRLMRVGCDLGCDVAATDIRRGDQTTSFRVSGVRYAFPGDRPSELKAALATVAVGQMAGLTCQEIAMKLSSLESDRTALRTAHVAV